MSLAISPWPAICIHAWASAFIHQRQLTVLAVLLASNRQHHDVVVQIYALQWNVHYKL